jgi:methionyl-tRNA formyltransferase
MAGTERIKLLNCQIAAGHGAPGQVLDGFTIACGTGAVRIIQAQRDGKRPMDAVDLLRGMTLPDKLD